MTPPVGRASRSPIRIAAEKPAEAEQVLNRRTIVQPTECRHYLGQSDRLSRRFPVPAPPSRGLPHQHRQGSQ